MGLLSFIEKISGIENWMVALKTLFWFDGKYTRRKKDNDEVTLPS